MGNKYQVLAARYPYIGCWDKSEQFNTLRQAVRYIKKCQKQGYVIINLFCRDIKEKNNGNN